MNSGEIDQTLAMLGDDKEILDRVSQLRGMNLKAWDSILRLEVPMSIEELEELSESAEGIEAKVREIQELINKRLEEL